MHRIASIAAVSAIALATAAGLRAQEGRPDARELPAAGDAEARQVLEQARDALAKLQSARYSARHAYTFPEGSGVSYPEATGEVLIAEVQGEDPVGARLRVEGRMLKALEGGGDLPFRLAYDGSKVRGVLLMPAAAEADRVVWEAELAAGGSDLLEMGRRLVIEDLYADEPLAEELADAESVELLPGRDVAGVACDVVALRFGADDQPARAEWAFGRDDHLPREVKSWSRTDMGEVAEQVTLSDVQTGVEHAADAFQLAVPEGYRLEPMPTGGQQAGTGLLAVGSQAPDWSLKTPGGEVVKLSDLRGKVVVLDFWATWCAPCKKAMPGIQKLHERFQGEDVAVYGLSTWEREGGDPAGYMREKGYTYGLLVEAAEVAEAYGVRGIPAFFVIGADGEVLLSDMGAGNEEKLAEVVEANLPGRR